MLSASFSGNCFASADIQVQSRLSLVSHNNVLDVTDVDAVWRHDHNSYQVTR